ncbi:MAG: amidohydrolase family protein, partial [Blastocatellia bacterium]
MRVKQMMKTAAIALISISTMLGATPSASVRAQTQQTKPIAIIHVTVIDMTGAAPKPDMTVVLTADRISEIGPASKLKVPSGSDVIDGRGKYLIPGLWDMHVHT